MQNPLHDNKYINANRRAWNQVAPIHADANQARLLLDISEMFKSLEPYQKIPLSYILVGKRM